MHEQGGESSVADSLEHPKVGALTDVATGIVGDDGIVDSSMPQSSHQLLEVERREAIGAVVGPVPEPCLHRIDAVRIGAIVPEKPGPGADLQAVTRISLDPQGHEERRLLLLPTPLLQEPIDLGGRALKTDRQNPRDEAQPGGRFGLQPLGNLARGIPLAVLEGAEAGGQNQGVSQRASVR